MREETVAKENAERVSPARVDRRLRAPPFGFIDDVVMNECGDVNQFHDDGEIDVLRCHPAECAAAEKSHQWAETLSPAAEGVGNIPFDCRIKCSGLLGNSLFDTVQLGRDQTSDSRQWIFRLGRNQRRVHGYFH